jgi:hypothetical protein
MDNYHGMRIREVGEIVTGVTTVTPLGGREVDGVEQALKAAGWTVHDGSHCPVDANSYPIVLSADGSTDCERASEFDWLWNDPLHPGGRVIAYRLVD